MANLEASVFLVTPPDITKTKFVLMLHKDVAPSPFGGGGGGSTSSVFGVDKLSLVVDPETKVALAYQGTLADDTVVVQFPAATRYTLVNANTMIQMTRLEAESMAKKEEEELKSLYKEDTPAETPEVLAEPRNSPYL